MLNKLKEQLFFYQNGANRGSALIQVMVVGTLVGAIAFFTGQNQISTQQFLKTEMAKTSLKRLVARVEAILSKEELCNASSVYNLPTNSTSVLTSVTVGGGATGEDNFGTVLKVGNNYGPNDTFQLTSLKLVISDPANNIAQLDMVFTVNSDNANAVFIGPKTINRTINIKYADLDTNLFIDSCFADSVSAIDDIIDRFCRGKGAIFSPLLSRCFLIGMNPLVCPDGYLVQSLIFDTVVDHKMERVCGLPATNIFTSSSCPANQIPIGITAAGAISCVSLSLPYIDHLVDSTSVDCTAKPLRRLIMSGATNKIIPECGTATPTPVPTSSPTPNTTPSATPTITPTPTATFTPGGPTSTPTPTPTNTPTAGGTGCPGVQGGPFPDTFSVAPQNITADSDGFKYQVAAGNFDKAFRIHSLSISPSFPSMRNLTADGANAGLKAYSNGESDIGPPGTATQEIWMISRIQIQVGDNAQFANSYVETSPPPESETAQFGNGKYRGYIYESMDLNVQSVHMGLHVKKKNLNVSEVLCATNQGDPPCWQNGLYKYYGNFIPSGGVVVEINALAAGDVIIRVKKSGTNIKIYQTNVYPGGNWEEIGSYTINCVGNYETDPNYIGVRFAGMVAFDRIPANGQLDQQANWDGLWPYDLFSTNSGRYYPNFFGEPVEVQSLFSGSIYSISEIITNP
jgi:hypothetical protein